MVIIMRIYYVFNIKKEVFDIYKTTPSVLFNFFNRIYFLNKDNLNYSNSIYKQISNKFDKEILDLKIFIKLHNKVIYSKKKDEHIINNLFKDEISIMKVKKSYIVINTNKNYTQFFNILYYFYNNCLVCDFVNQDYFFLDNVKMLV